MQSAASSIVPTTASPAAALPVSALPATDPSATDTGLAALAAFVRTHPKLQVLTGAGISTGSGIPDYRDEAGAWKRRPPVSHQDFMGQDHVRRRYWARSLIGWPTMSRAHPNAAHAALAQLQGAGRVGQLLTQNVDGLHQRAGSTDVLELHGSIHEVGCMECAARYPRSQVQEEMARANPRFAQMQGSVAPDGDADLEAEFDDFIVPACAACGGLLKPGVVFFGDGVPRARLDEAMAGLAQSDALLVVGSSLMVYSGYRFALKARELGKPVAAINLGRTRADELFALKVQSPCAEALQGLLERLDA